MSLRKTVLALLALALAVLLGSALAAMPEPVGVAGLVEARLSASAVENPVTAVLLNFRSYDTLLELAVLLLAAVGAVLMPTGEPGPASRDRPRHGPVESGMLDWFARRFSPAAIVFGSYLWWTGSSHPGGAFQAGAVLAGGAALFLLAGLQPAPSGRGRFRYALAAGLIAFLVAGIVPMLTGAAFLDYPGGWAKVFIVVIEAFAVVSIAGGLTVLLAGAPTATGGEGEG